MRSVCYSRWISAMLFILKEDGHLIYSLNTSFQVGSFVCGLADLNLVWFLVLGLISRSVGQWGSAPDGLGWLGGTSPGGSCASPFHPPGPSRPLLLRAVTEPFHPWSSHFSTHSLFCASPCPEWRWLMTKKETSVKIPQRMDWSHFYQKWQK